MVGQTGEALRNINGEVGRIHDIVSDIANSGRAQAQKLVNVNDQVMEIEKIAKQNAATVEETAVTFAELASGVRILDELVGRFKFTGPQSPSREIRRAA